MRDFIAMRDWLQPPPVPQVATPEPAPEAPANESAEAHEPLPGKGAIRRFDAALQDALTLATGELLREIACEVLGREIRHPCDISNLVRRAIERYGTEPLRVHVHPADLELASECGYAVVADESLRTGDALLVLECGTIDARLGTRLQRVLDEAIA